MQQWKRTPVGVDLRPSDGHETVAPIKSDRIGVLFVDIELKSRDSVERLAEERATYASAAVVVVDEEHLEPVAVGTREPDGPTTGSGDA